MDLNLAPLGCKELDKYISEKSVKYPIWHWEVSYYAFFINFLHLPTTSGMSCKLFVIATYSQIWLIILAITWRFLNQIFSVNMCRSVTELGLTLYYWLKLVLLFTIFYKTFEFLFLGGKLLIVLNDDYIWTCLNLFSERINIFYYIFL